MHPIEVLGNALLFTLVFAMSATVDIDCMKEQLRNKKAILLGVFCQFFLLPILGFATVNLLNLSAPIGITLLVVTSSPGGSYSSWCDIIDSFRGSMLTKILVAFSRLVCGSRSLLQVVFHVQCGFSSQCGHDCHFDNAFPRCAAYEPSDIRQRYL